MHSPNHNSIFVHSQSSRSICFVLWNLYFNRFTVHTRINYRHHRFTLRSISLQVSAQCFAICIIACFRAICSHHRKLLISINLLGIRLVVVSTFGHEHALIYTYIFTSIFIDWVAKEENSKQICIAIIMDDCSTIPCSWNSNAIDFVYWLCYMRLQKYIYIYQRNHCVSSFIWSPFKG